MNKIQMLKNDLLKKSEIENSIAADVFKPVVLTEEEENSPAFKRKQPLWLRILSVILLFALRLANM